MSDHRYNILFNTGEQTQVTGTLTHMDSTYIEFTPEVNIVERHEDGKSVIEMENRQRFDSSKVVGVFLMPSVMPTA